MATEQRLFEKLSFLRDSQTVIVGIGNTLRGDDSAGPLVCEQLRELNVCADVVDTATVPENYIQSIIKKAPRNLLIVDAIDFNAPPGTIEIFKPEQLNPFVFSTHILSPRVFVDMIHSQIDVDVCLIGIQPAQTDIGQALSVQVADAIQRLSQTLIEIFPPRK
jgi:hydrogenase maturation protease HycI